MKRIAWIQSCLQSFALAACAFSLAAPTVAAAADTIKPNTLMIGSDLTYPPYDFLTDGKPSGFDPAFMNKLSAHMQTKADYLDTRFANLIVGVDASRFDVIASALYVTPERAKQIDFIPYFKTGGALLALAASGFAPKTADDLCGKRVGSIKGASWIPKLAEVSQRVCVPTGRGAIDVREFDTSPEAAQALLSHAVDAQFEDAAVAKIMVDKLGGRAIITSSGPLYPVVVGLGVKKGNTALLSAMRGAFTAMQQSGEYAQLLKQYNVAAPSQAEIAASMSGVKQ